MERASESFWANANLKFLAMGTCSQMQDSECGRDAGPKFWNQHISGDHPLCQLAKTVQCIAMHFDQRSASAHRQMLYSICCQSASTMVHIPSLKPYNMSILSHGCIITLSAVCYISVASSGFSAISCSEITRFCTQLRP